jgi:hypothetical protein
MLPSSPLWLKTRPGTKTRTVQRHSLSDRRGTAHVQVAARLHRVRVGRDGGTFSDHQELGPARLAALPHALRRIIQQQGGTLEAHGGTYLWSARKVT